MAKTDKGGEVVAKIRPDRDNRPRQVREERPKTLQKHITHSEACIVLHGVSMENKGTNFGRSPGRTVLVRHKSQSADDLV